MMNRIFWSLPKTRLKTLGYHTIVAENGKQALQKLGLKAGTTFDLAITAKCGDARRHQRL